jgi:hypothetical protein
MNRHERLELFAGDDWQIDATMIDPNGNPMDLTGAVLMWTLLNDQGFRVVDVGDFAITLGTEPGTVTVKITAEASALIAPGSHTDWWRVTPSDGITQTLLTGDIGVHSDPLPGSARNGMRVSLLKS